MTRHQLSTTKLTYRYPDRLVLQNVSLEVSTGSSLGLAGSNGSGKTTLLKCLAGLFRPSAGSVTLRSGDADVGRSSWKIRIGLVGPYIAWYDELSAEENLVFFTSAVGCHVEGKELDNALDRFGLKGRGVDPVGSFSTGMKQRLQFVLLTLRMPPVMLLDEPTATLDQQGRAAVTALIEEQRDRAAIVIASNDEEDLGLAKSRIQLS